jgi:hypothetical protein
MHPGTLEIFGLADRLRRKIVDRVLYLEGLAGAESVDKPVELPRKRP